MVQGYTQQDSGSKDRWTSDLGLRISFTAKFAISDYPIVRHFGAGWTKNHGANDDNMLKQKVSFYA